MKDTESEIIFIEYRRCNFGRKKAPAGAHPVTQSLETTCVMYLRHKNEDSLFIKYRKSIFAGKTPAGAHPVALNLESTCSMYLRHKNIVFYVLKTQKSRFYVSKIENLCFCWKKAPAGAHPGAQSLESTCFKCSIHKN